MAYATITDLTRLGINSDALAPISTDSKTDMLVACSALVDDAIATGGRYSPPLTTYPWSITLNVCKLAQFELISVDGYMPDDDDQVMIRKRWEDANAWLEKLANGAAISGAVDATPDEEDNEVTVVSETARGWNYGSDPTETTEDDLA